MLFSSPKSPITLKDNVKINDKHIVKTNKVKFLGVTIHENINWKEHINILTRNISKTVFVLNKSKHLLDTNEMILLYNTLVKPHLEYACEVWSNTYKSHMHRLEIIQKRVIRSIFKLPINSHTQAYFAKQKYLNLMT